MANSKEIRVKIASVGNTKKITKAMEMVAGSKMRKTQQRMNATRPYAEKCLQVVQNLTKANPEYTHAYLKERESIKGIGIIVVSTDRGLCGGLNSNLFRKILKEHRESLTKNTEVKFAVIGSKGASFFKILGRNVTSVVTHIGDTPELSSILGVIQAVLSEFDDGKIDKIFVASNKFVNNITQEPQITQLVPVILGEKDNQEGKNWDYLYEPNAEHVLNLLLERYVEAMIFNAVVENLACEQSARMLAMKNASDNAGELIEDLKLVYNKARQAAITQELSEIVAGAAAV